MSANRRRLYPGAASLKPARDDVHRVHLCRGQRHVPEQARGDVRQVAHAVAVGRDALVDLEQVHLRPRHVFGPRAVAACAMACAPS